ncbi:MAG: hypothetical protein WCL10_09895 [Novosphingobium sp.]|uniref:hypothetical protein n=1 Tax=Novosphingobium sp. TaxID=1874826 RepID=UPI003018D235
MDSFVWLFAPHLRTLLPKGCWSLSVSDDDWPEPGNKLMLNDLLKADDAVRQIEAAVRGNRRVFGVDGFRVVPQGYIAALDLILDVSNEPMEPVAAATKTIQFIRLNAADDVLFEVVIEVMSDDRFPTRTRHSKVG